MSFIAPLSPPDDLAHHHCAPGDATHSAGLPRTAERKRTGLRKTRTESSLPTPPRTRERKMSHSPNGTTEDPASATKPRRATSSSARPFGLPASSQPIGGLYPAAELDEPSSRAGSSSSSSGANAFAALSPPLTSSRGAKRRHPAHRNVDSLGPTRTAALKGGYVSVEWKAPCPPPPAFAPSSTPVDLPPLPAPRRRDDSKTRPNRDPRKGPVFEEGNPFVEGFGLKDKGLVSETQRVGTLEEKETIGYVFRGTKTVFANPFYTGHPHMPHASSSSSASALDPSHPEFTPAANPAPRLLFPALSGPRGKRPGSGSRSLGYAANESDDDDDDDDEMQAVPRRLFAAGPTGKQRAAHGFDTSDEEEDEDATMLPADAPEEEAADRRGRTTRKRPLDAFGPAGEGAGQAGGAGKRARGRQ